MQNKPSRIQLINSAKRQLETRMITKKSRIVTWNHIMRPNHDEAQNGYHTQNSVLAS